MHTAIIERQFGVPCLSFALYKNIDICVFVFIGHLVKILNRKNNSEVKRLKTFKDLTE